METTLEIKKTDLFDLHKIAEKIDLPVDEWAGNCYGLALAFVHHGIVKGRARYGHWLGDVHPKSIFYKHSGCGFIQHGWVELPNGSIVDPTRFAFEDKEPYIYQGINDNYDIGGASFRDSMRASQGAPKYNATDKQIVLELPNNILQLLHLICEEKREGNKFSLTQAFWIGNANPAQLGTHAKSIYKEFERNKNDAFIPQDYWTLIMEEA